MIANHPAPVWRATLLVLAVLLPAEAQARKAERTYLSDRALYARAIKELTERVGADAKLLSVKVEPRRIVAQVQGERRAEHVDEWELRLGQGFLANGDILSGPRAVQPTGPGRDVVSAFFPLADVDLGLLPSVLEAALERAGLEDESGASSAVLQRRFFVLPQPSWGDVRWTVQVSSDRERATVTTNAAGRVVWTDLTQTNRLRGLDYTNRDDAPYAEAQARLLDAVGAGQSVYKVNVGTSTIDVDAVLPGADKRRQKLIWDPARGMRVDNLVASLGIDPHLTMDKSLLPFGLKDVDLGALPRLRAQARTALEMPNARLVTITAEMNRNRPKPELLWSLGFRDATGESATVLASMTGEIRSVELPESRRKPVNRLAPAAIADALAELRRSFGDDAKVASITVDERGPMIVLDDPERPGYGLRYITGRSGLVRFGTPMPHFPGTAIFRLGETKAVSAEQIQRFQARTVERMNLTGAEVFRVTIDRRAMPGRREAGLAVEVRAGIERGDRGGRIVFSPDGREIEVIRP